ncbi:DUF3466 family protein [Nostoc sp. UHCC 0702]|nr:DUF3466 family protein [Nostoc sp. UHCC 0702]
MSLLKWKACVTAVAVTAISFTASKSALAVSLYSVTDLGALTGETYSYAQDINDLGEVIINTSRSSFFYSNGSLNKISPLPGDNALAVESINNLGQVVGNSVNINNFTRNNPFVYSNGVTQALPIRDAIPYDINDSGQVVGGASQIGAFLYSNGTTTSIGTPGNVAYALNNSGQIVGILDENAAFLYENGQTTRLSPFPGYNYYSSATDVNDLGQVVWYLGLGDARAFLYSPGEGSKDLGRLRSTDQITLPLAINNSGQVVGFSGTDIGFSGTDVNTQRAFLYENNTLYDLNELIAPGSNTGLGLTRAEAINNRGQIVGSGAINGELHAFLLTPVSSTSVPESNLSFPILTFSAFMSLFTSLKRKSGSSSTEYDKNMNVVTLVRQTDYL